VSRDYQLYLADIAERCGRIIKGTAGLDQPAFLSNEWHLDATLRNLEVMGEAVKHIPDEIRLLAPDIPWSLIARFRDLIVHSYFRVDPAEVWNIVEVEVPVLLQHVKALQSALADRGDDPAAP